MKTPLALSLAVLLVAGCAPDQAPPRTESVPAPRPEASAPEPVFAGSAVEGSAAFGVELYKQLGAKRGNVFISPASLSTAFGMTYAGARGETARELAAALRFGPQERLHGELGALGKSLNADKAGARLELANALWTQTGFRLEPAFESLIGRHYGGAVRRVDFVREAEALRTVNGWVAERTNGRIRDLLGPDHISPLTRLVLTNTVYFKGDWLHPFNPKGTKPGPFHAPGGPVTAPLMRLGEVSLRHWDGGAFQAVEIPYRGEAVSMVVLLPKARDGLPALEGSLSGPELTRWLTAVSQAPVVDVDLTLPRFTARNQFELKPALQAMGVRQAFQEAEADFSGMSSETRLLIEAVVHATFVAVDETGTEAAGATGVVVRAVSARPPPVPFRADHPFLYLIRDKATGAVLFFGRLERPEAAQPS